MGMTTRRTAVVGIGAAVAATVAAATWLRKPPAPEIATPVVGPSAGPAPAPELRALDALKLTDPPVPPADASFTDADGTTHRLSDFRGKGLVVNLWATWCVPCVAELPSLAALANRTAGSDIAVLAISSDRGGADVVRKFLASHDIAKLGIWLDPKGEATRAWGARGIPTTLLIDREGRERARFEGSADWSSDRSMVRLKELIG